VSDALVGQTTLLTLLFNALVKEKSGRLIVVLLVPPAASGAPVPFWSGSDGVTNIPAPLLLRQVAMDDPMLPWNNERKVLWLIVCPISVKVVNVRALRNWAVIAFPHDAMKPLVALFLDDPAEILAKSVVPDSCEFLDCVADNTDSHPASLIRRGMLLHTSSPVKSLAWTHAPPCVRNLWSGVHRTDLPSSKHTRTVGTMR
jgi:hypothetical protein